MNRRGFLTRLAQTAAFVAVAPAMRVLAPREQIIASMLLSKQTTFGTLDARVRYVWSRKFWDVAANKSFVRHMVGGKDAPIQLITDLPKQYTRDEQGMINFVASFV